MDIDIEKIVLDASNGVAKTKYKNKLDFILYPDAFANENSWRTVRSAIEAQEQYIREYLTEALTEIVKQLSE